MADESTAGRCAWTKHDFNSSSKWSQTPTPRKLDSEPRRFGAVPSRTRWFLTLAAAVAAIGALLGLLGQGIVADAREASVKMADLWDRGFGSINTISLIGKGRGGNVSWQGSTISMVILANTPQLLLSILYFSYNTLFTSMTAGNEWSRFGRRATQADRKTLRVSKPRDEQRGSYYLQLPLRISVPLIIVSIILHWLTSQSLFLAKVSGMDSHGLNTQNFVTTCGYSNIAIIFGIFAGTLVTIALICTSTLRLASNMPIVGSSSAAISAACHPLRANVDPYRDTVGWGVEPLIEGASSGDSGDDQQPSHCTLTSGETRVPLKGEVFA